MPVHFVQFSGMSVQLIMDQNNFIMRFQTILQPRLCWSFIQWLEGWLGYFFTVMKKKCCILPSSDNSRKKAKFKSCALFWIISLNYANCFVIVKLVDILLPEAIDLPYYIYNCYHVILV